MPRPRISPSLNPDDRTIIARGPDVSSLLGDNQPYLHIIHPRDKANRYPITENGLVLGRGTEVDVFLSDAQISRKHCLIRKVNDAIQVEDLNSTNGTQVDGESITECLLPPSGRLRIGGYVMRVEYRAAAELQAEEQLKEAAKTDELTGVPNRRWFFQEAAEILAISLRDNKPLSYVMIDIDRFKEVNDRLGHAAGDFVLKRVSEILLAEKRTADILARYGGEEFVMLLPDTGREDAFLFCDRLCEKIGEQPIDFHGNFIHTHISVGVHTRNAAEHHSIDEAINAADEAMYRAKNKGRNRVSD